MTRDLLHDDLLVLCVITHLVVDIGIRALPRGSFVGTFGHGCIACHRWMLSPSRWPRYTFRLCMTAVDPQPGPECTGVLLSPQLLRLGTRSPRFPPFRGYGQNMGTCFRLLLIVLTPSNAPKCRGSKRGTLRPPGWRPRTHGDKIGPSYLNPAFSGAKKWADWLHNRCLLRVPQGYPRVKCSVLHECKARNYSEAGVSLIIGINQTNHSTNQERPCTTIRGSLNLSIPPVS